MLLPVLDEYSVGEHPISARLLKGMFYVRPPEPRYSFTWYVNVLFSFLEFPLSALDLWVITTTLLPENIHNALKKEKYIYN